MPRLFYLHLNCDSITTKIVKNVRVIIMITNICSYKPRVTLQLTKTKIKSTCMNSASEINENKKWVLSWNGFNNYPSVLLGNCNVAAFCRINGN